MILIFSIEQDESTIDVLKWLSYLKQDFLLINNEKDVVEGVLELGIDNFRLKILQKEIDFNDIKSVWYRRGSFSFFRNVKDNKLLGEKVNEYLKSEKLVLNEFMHEMLESKYCVNNYNFKNVNKLIVLRDAKRLGLKIPESKVVNSKISLESNSNDSKSITKALSESFAFYGDTYWIPNYTSEINGELLDKLGVRFAPSLVQSHIDKKYEIRSFLFEKKLYSMAIFSQKDNKTKTDFRQYNHDYPNRTVPFDIPKSIEDKLLKLAEKQCLNSCSFDLIYTNDNEFIFLEVNPIGQFGMVSYPCNYYLEKKIAKSLMYNG